MAEKAQDISEIGEFGLIDLITQNIALKHSTSLKGIGDDAAVLASNTENLVVTTDMLTEGIHFDLVYTPLRHLGYKAVVVNLSDVYAMNAQPQQVLVSIAVSSKFKVDMIEELYEGIKLACEFYKVDLVGGDTTSSLTGLTISVTAIGRVEPNRVVYRSGAKPNDLICVSGDLGAAYLGLQLLEREKRIFTETNSAQPDLTGFEYVLERHLKPEARRDIIEELRQRNLQPTSMIDISDGLSSELMHLCKQSESGCLVYLDKIPVAAEMQTAAEEFNFEPTTIALNGGEDYELLFTLPLSDYEKVQSWNKVSVIGHIVPPEQGRYLVAPDGSLLELKAMGWNGLQ